jgi:hypothetical protein
MDLLVEVLTVLGLIAAILSVAVYSRVPWWKSAVGRSLMLYMTAVMLLFIIFFLAAVVHAQGTPVYFAFSRVGYAFLIAALWWQLVVLIRSQKWVHVRDRTGGSRDISGGAA